MGLVPWTFEIAENLHRSELTKQERADHIVEWIRLTKAQIEAEAAVEEPEEDEETPDKVTQVESVSRGGRGNQGGTREATRALGLSLGEVQRAEKIAAMTPEARAVVSGTPALADNQAALLRIVPDVCSFT